jgi:hypothetical protein
MLEGGGGGGSTHKRTYYKREYVVGDVAAPLLLDTVARQHTLPLYIRLHYSTFFKVLRKLRKLQDK